MRTFLQTANKNNLIISGGLLVVSVLGLLFSVVVNHYKHNLGLPLFTVTLIYLAYTYAKEQKQYQSKNLELIFGSLAVVSVLAWGLMLKNPTSDVYLGSERVIMNSSKDVRQIKLSHQVDSNKHRVILYFNPNCKTCIEAIPDIVSVLDTSRWQRIAFVDTTQDFGRQLASKNGVDKVPSYSDVEGYDVGRLAYDTEDGVEVFQNEVYRFHVLASSEI